MRTATVLIALISAENCVSILAVLADRDFRAFAIVERGAGVSILAVLADRDV